jgi:hypothetical protein
VDGDQIVYERFGGTVSRPRSDIVRIDRTGEGSMNKPGTRPGVPSAPPPVSLTTPSAIANPAHAKLLALPKAGLTVVLAKIVQTAGDACTRRDVEFKGINKATGQAFWRVDCARCGGGSKPNRFGG